MEVVFESMKLKNFRSFVEADVTFVPGVHLVLGRNEKESSADSNGAGKSTIFSYAPPYIIFGRFKSPNGKIVRTGMERRNADDNCFGEMNLRVSNQPIVITRGRSKGKPFLKLSGTKTPVKADQELSFLVGCDFDAFSSLQVLTRSSFESGLFYGTDTQRKDFFLSVAGIDKLIEQSLEVLKSDKVDYSLKALEMRTMYNAEESANTLAFRMSEINQEVLRLESNISSADLLIANYQSELMKRTDELVATQGVLKEKERKVLELSEVSGEFKRLHKMYEEKGELQGKVNSLKDAISERSKYCARLQSLSGAECLNCGQLVREDYVRKILTNMQEIIQSSKTALKEAESTFDKTSSSISEMEELKRQVDNLDRTLQAGLRTLRDEINRLQSDIRVMTSQYEQALQNLQQYKDAREAHTCALEELRRREHFILRRLGAIRDDALCFGNLESACLKWVDFFKNQLPAQALTDITKFLGNFSEQCLRTLWDMKVSMQVYFDPATQKPIIDVKDSDGDLVNIDSLSGGEQARVYLSLTLGSILATRSFRGWSSNLFVLDEVFDGCLDRTGREIILSLLHEMALKFNLCVYVISHHLDYARESVPGSIYTSVKTVEGSYLEVS
jgi:DNA repair exonuclease SbcCD ATPase subunit